jgi:hypothetical protein
MAHDVAIEVAPPVEEEPGHSASARRMRVHRERRRRGLRCVTVALGESQIEWLVWRGFLPRAERANRIALQKALGFYLADNLGRRATPTASVKV